MICIFASADSIVIENGEEQIPPKFALDPCGSGACYRLIAIDAVVVDDEPEVAAFYERVTISQWTRAVRELAPQDSPDQSREK